MRCRVSALLLALLAVAACGDNKPPTSPSAQTLNLSGNWAGDLPVQDSLARMTWTVTQNNNTVTGPVLIVLPTGVVLLNGALSGTLSGSTLNYTIDVTPGGIPSEPACSGRLGGLVTAAVGQATLTGSYEVRSSSCTPQFSSGSFTLTKQ